jgi:hypothetical protein
MSARTLDGGCHCGAIRYRLYGAPTSSSICFCRSCRLSSGAPLVGWLTVPVESLEWLTEHPKHYASSPGVTRTFCSTCGTPLSYRHDDSPATIDLTTVTLDRPEDVAPTHETWLSDKLSWATSDKELQHWPTDYDPGLR